MGHTAASKSCSSPSRLQVSCASGMPKVVMAAAAQVLGVLEGETSRAAEPKPVVHTKVAINAGYKESSPQPTAVKEETCITGDNVLPQTEEAKTTDSSNAPTCDEVVALPAGREFVTGLGQVLARWVKATPTPSRTEGSSTSKLFRSVHPPPIAINAYLTRIQKYFGCSDECFVIALVIMDRAGRLDSAMTVCDLNVHRLLLTAMMVAAKSHDDKYYSNDYYAKVGGMALKEANELEISLLKLMDWRVVVSSDEYQHYHSLVGQAMQNQ